MINLTALRYHYNAAFQAFGLRRTPQRVLPRLKAGGIPVPHTSLVSELSAYRKHLRNTPGAYPSGVPLPKISVRDGEVYLVEPNQPAPASSSIRIENPADGTLLPCMKALVTLFTYKQLVGTLTVNTTPESRAWLEDLEADLTEFGIEYHQNAVTFQSHL